MDLTIHAYGYSELIFHALQGLAMFRESNFYISILNMMMLFVGVFYAMQMAAARVEGQWRSYLLKTIGMIVFANSLLLPKTSMYIRDHVEKSYWQVDNIPLAFALPIGAVESFGHIITMGFEQTFSLVGSRSSLLYYHYGTVFGARLAKEVLNAKIRDPEVVGNMNNFIRRCVILPAMIGHKFTKEELVSTNDIWGLVSGNAGNLARVDMVIDRRRVSPSPTCSQAVPYFEQKFAENNNRIFTKLSQKFRGAGTNVEYNPGIRQLNRNMSIAISGLYGQEHRVSSILKNNIMINAINSYRSGKYANARAQMHQEAGGILSGDLAEKTLTGSLALMKVLVYTAFIFLLPLLILSGGFAKYKSWIVMVFSLSLWPPLFSILNMVIDFAYEPAKIVSYSSWSTEMKKFDSIGSLAAGLTISIPFLAYYMTRLGEGGFMQLAGTIMASSNAATNAIASEKSSGSRSFDNDNIGNSSYHNNSGFKTNHNLEYFNGENGWNLSDGAQMKLTPSGRQIITGGSGRTSSAGDATYRLEEGTSEVLREGLSEQLSLAESDSRSLSTARAKTISNQASMLESIADSTRSSSGYNIDTSTEQGKAIDRILSEVDRLEESNNYGWRQNATSTLSSYAKGELGGKIFGGFLGANLSGGISAEGNVGAENTSDQNNHDSVAINKENSSREFYNEVSRALANDSWIEEHNVTKDMSESLHDSYEESARAEKQLSQRHENIDNYQKALDYSKTTGSSSSRDVYQEVLENYARSSGKSMQDARIDVEKRTPEVRKIFNDLAKKEAGHILEEVHQGKEYLQTSTVNPYLDNMSRIYNSTVSNDHIAAGELAKDKNFNSKEIREKVTGMGQQNQEKFQNYQQESQKQYNEVHDANKIQRKEMKEINEQHEEDRIGKGGMASGAASLLGDITRGRAGNSIGRPDKKLTDQEIADIEAIRPTYRLYNGEIICLDDLFPKNDRSKSNNKDTNPNVEQKADQNTIKHKKD